MDHGQMEQIIMNIAVNARDAMPTGGKLTIETVNLRIKKNHALIPPGNYVMMSISDTGIGMSDAIKSHIFEPFFTTKEKGIGTGLGLATVYAILQQCNGHITVQSAPGKGTTIQIYLPRITKPATNMSETRVALSEIRGSETILVVEDEGYLREMIDETLSSFGYAVITASGAQKAISLCNKYKNKINCILTDVIMPKMDGRQFIDSIKPLYPKTKVLFMSGYTDDEVLRHGIYDMETDFIQKPFTPVDLVRKIREILDRKE
jgi:two-component system cell cycle sensor histidine kinase/response regulator CckA